MAKFCTFCGTQLQEGVSCTCRAQAAVIENNTQHDPAQQTQQFIPVNQESKFSKFCNSMLALFKQFFKTPALVTRMVARNHDFKAGLFYAAIQSVFTGLFALILIKKGIEGTMSIAAALYRSFGIGGFGLVDYDVPYLKIFFQIFFFMAFQFFILVAVTFGISKLFKARGYFKTLIGVIGVATIPFSLAVGASMLFAFIYPALIIFLLIFGVLMSILLAMSGVSEAMSLDEDKVGYVITISYVAYYIVLTLLAYSK